MVINVHSYFYFSTVGKLQKVSTMKDFRYALSTMLLLFIVALTFIPLSYIKSINVRITL